jgi:hypothetical protein
MQASSVPHGGLFTILVASIICLICTKLIQRVSSIVYDPDCCHMRCHSSLQHVRLSVLSHAGFFVRRKHTLKSCTSRSISLMRDPRSYGMFLEWALRFSTFLSADALLLPPRSSCPPTPMTSSPTWTCSPGTASCTPCAAGCPMSPSTRCLKPLKPPNPAKLPSLRECQKVGKGTTVQRPRRISSIA